MTEQEQRRLADLETANAQAQQSAAERQRDAIAGVAVNESVHRAAAENVAAAATMRANQAESRERTMATSAGLARQDASIERAAASNATFTTTIISVLGVTVVLALIGYFAWWQPNHHADVSTNTFIRTDKTTEKASPPQNVVVKQPNVNVNVVVPESKPKPEENPKSEEKPPAEVTPETDKGEAPGKPSDGDSTKAPETKSGTDNP